MSISIAIIDELDNANALLSVLEDSLTEDYARSYQIRLVREKLKQVADDLRDKPDSE
jgi:hypothetical protein